MSDILERLRLRQSRIVDGTMHTCSDTCTHPDCLAVASLHEIERLTRRMEGATRLLNAWHFEYHHGRRLEGIDDDTTTWLGGIDLPGSAADQPAAAPDFKAWREAELRYVIEACGAAFKDPVNWRDEVRDLKAWATNRLRAADNSGAAE